MTKCTSSKSASNINIEKLKFRPIIDQITTFTYNCTKVIAEYIKAPCRNGYSIKGTNCFPEMLRDLHLLNNDEDFFSFDVDSLFTNTPLKERLLMTF